MKQIQRLKLILLGEFGVGKTSFFYRVKNGYFPKDTLSTLSREAFQKTYHILHNGQPQEVEVTLWDTFGEERFDSLSSTYYRYTSAAILMYSVDKQETLEQLVHWISSASSYCDDVKLFLVGNKNDLEDKIPKDKVQRFAQEHTIQSVFKLSAKTGKNVEESLQNIVESSFPETKLPDVIPLDPCEPSVRKTCEC